MRFLSAAVLASLLLAAPPGWAEAPQHHDGGKRADLADTTPPNPLPAPVTTEHVLQLPGRTLKFTATAGAIRLSNSQTGAPLADIAYKAYRVPVEDGGQARPLIIALNGGPGASSAWLDLGALGPWRLPIAPNDISASGDARVIDNADTWLDVADLLFIDPMGTGYSRPVGKGEEAEKSFYSVDGDIDSLTTVIRKWLVANNRLVGPKFIVGESYGGFRAPRLARALEQKEGVGIDGLIMISPVLDFGWFFAENNPAMAAAHLPSLVAAARGLDGTDPRPQLADAEAYAAGPYLVDLFKGASDGEARERMSRNVAKLTGLDLKFVERLGGRVGAATMMREKLREKRRIASAYDATVTGFDPDPFDAVSHPEDPILDTLKVPLAAAMADVTANKLKWPVNARYEILNLAVNNRWDWDHGRSAAESLSALGKLLALDPHFHALVMHGVQDQVTPYFATQLLINQLPPYGGDNRLALRVYGGGHMPYLDDKIRAAMHADAAAFIANRPK